MSKTYYLQPLVRIKVPEGSTPLPGGMIQTPDGAVIALRPQLYYAEHSDEALEGTDLEPQNQQAYAETVSSLPDGAQLLP